MYITQELSVYMRTLKLIKKNWTWPRGGSLDNAIVVKNNEILNLDGLRNEK